MPFVTVLKTQDTFAAKLATAALEDVGIQYVKTEEGFGVLPGIFGVAGIGETPMWRGVCRIQVAAEDESEARELLDSLRDPEPLPDDGH